MATGVELIVDGSMNTPEYLYLASAFDQPSLSAAPVLSQGLTE